MGFRPIAWHKVDFGKIAFFGMLTFAAIFLGFASAILPPLYVLIFASIPLSVFLAAAFPALALSAVLVISFGLLPQFIFGSLPLGGARLQPAELMLMLTFGILLLRGAGLWQGALTPAKSLMIPFFLLAIGIAIGFFKGKILAHYQYAGADFRQYIGWLALPVALWLVRQNPLSIHRLVLVISLLASVGMIFQLVTGIQVIYGFRGAEALSKDFKDITRSAIGGGGVFLSYSAYYLFSRFCDAKRGQLENLLGLVVILGGLAASFSRGIWAGVFVGAIVFLAITPQFRRSKTLVALMIVVVALTLGSLVSVAIPRVGEAVVERVLSVSEEGGRGSSVGFRFDENLQAWTAIQRSPILGAGLGAEYKVVFRQAQIGGGFDTEASLIHNAYMGLWLKLGILGFIFPFALILVLFLDLLKYRRKSKEVGNIEASTSSRAYAAFCGLVMMAVYGASSAEWSMFGSLAAASCMVALIVSVISDVTPTPKNAYPLPKAGSF
jgi:O-antigen ligase